MPSDVNELTEVSDFLHCNPVTVVIIAIFASAISVVVPVALLKLISSP